MIVLGFTAVIPEFEITQFMNWANAAVFVTALGNRCEISFAIFVT